MDTTITALTFTRHVDHEIDIHLHEALHIAVHAKFVVRPAPDELADVVQDEQEGEEADEEGEKAAGLGARLVGGRQLGEGVEAFEGCGGELIELVEERGLVAGAAEAAGAGAGGHDEQGVRGRLDAQMDRNESKATGRRRVSRSQAPVTSVNTWPGPRSPLTQGGAKRL